MTPAAMGQGRERKARLPPRQTGFAVAVGVRLPLSQWPCWWVCRVPECHQIDARPARGCAGCWRAYPWAGGLPGVRVGFRWAVPWAGCLPGGRAGAGGPTCGAMCVLGARGCVLGAGVPARGPWVCWLACLVACMLVRLPVVSWLKDAQIHPKTYARACHSAATSRAMCTIQAH